MERLFLGWDRLALPLALEALSARYSSGGALHLEGCLLVFPGRRGARRFLDLLAEPGVGCESLPKTMTMGELPEELYKPKFPFANSLTQELAWAEALRSLTSERMKVLSASVPIDEDQSGWLSLGRLLSVQHRELAADRLTFEDVISEAERLGGPSERLRWEILADVQRQYLAILDSLNLWDKQTARIEALKRREFVADRDIVLVGMVDLNRSQREMLDQVQERVTSLVFAPESSAHLFDEHGCLLADKWADQPIDLSRVTIKLVDGPREQADEVLESLVGLEGRYAANEIVVGLGDTALEPVLERAMSQAGLRTRSAVEQTVRQTLPSRLLETVAAFLQNPRMPEFLSLLRHPDLYQWLSEMELPANWLDAVDREVQETLPARPEQMRSALGGGERLRPLFDAIYTALDPLRQPPRVLSEWRGPIVELLLTIYSHVEFHTEVTVDRLTWEGCRALLNALEDQQRVPAVLCPAVTGAEALRMTIDMAGSGTIPPPYDPGAIELLGWLELSLDDAPVLLMTSFNEGRVPSSVNADPFLPNRLRKALQIEDNSRRYARDAYTLCALTHSREHLTLLLSRRTAEGDPLVPSRLLFATDDVTVARRVREFYDPEAAQDDSRGTAKRRRSHLGSDVDIAKTDATLPKGFRIARPQGGESLRGSISVTAFRDYLKSPYLYYLKHVRHVKSIDLSAQELSAGAFGTLAHDVLKRFSLGPYRESRKGSEIANAVNEELDSLIEERMWGTTLPAVDVQLAQLRARLMAFAERQAELTDEGWRIEFVEKSHDAKPFVFETGDGRSLELRGTIDRIDYHPETGRWRILDYKTSEKKRTPEQSHRTKDGIWKDLQLPLYRELARPLGVSGKVELAYFNLPKDLAEVGVEVADWDDLLLKEAVDVARGVMRKILDGEFWDLKQMPPDDELYDLEALLQCGTLDRDDTVYAGLGAFDEDEEESAW
ncbi:MAG: PD-(D/E)XK nuclease family protein [Planctomycetaceae bacterium]